MLITETDSDLFTIFLIELFCYLRKCKMDEWVGIKAYHRQFHSFNILLGKGRGR